MEGGERGAASARDWATHSSLPIPCLAPERVLLNGRQLQECERDTGSMVVGGQEKFVTMKAWEERGSGDADARRSPLPLWRPQEEVSGFMLGRIYGAASRSSRRTATTDASRSWSDRALWTAARVGRRPQGRSRRSLTTSGRGVWTAKRNA